VPTHPHRDRPRRDTTRRGVCQHGGDTDANTRRGRRGGIDRRMARRRAPTTAESTRCWRSTPVRQPHRQRHRRASIRLRRNPSRLRPRDDARLGRAISARTRPRSRATQTAVHSGELRPSVLLPLRTDRPPHRSRRNRPVHVRNPQPHRHRLPLRKRLPAASPREHPTVLLAHRERRRSLALPIRRGRTLRRVLRRPLRPRHG